ncbi:uncharacterized protein LOC110251407 [Exaiptasia diaphana]|uniref:MAM domain-containing protein n=1 Tax=Exaiptasia diaphana TaxID=2652724 RepID=A0A913Y2S4_EXADI|nr:uncharacterized protein LOC110251407 [Exaiptasia diaphana]
MFLTLVGILLLTEKLQPSVSENITIDAIVNGSSIPGQGYVYVLKRTIQNSTITSQTVMWVAFDNYSTIATIAKVACKMAGYKGPSSPSMPGYYVLNGWRLMNRNDQSNLNIWSCKGNEASLLQCDFNYSPKYFPLLVNCLPPDGPKHLHGISYDLWTQSRRIPTGFYESRWKHSTLFQDKPLSSHILQPTFDVMSMYKTVFGIKLSAYLMIKRPGEYSIGAACRHGCEVWWKRIQEPGLDDYGTSGDMIIKLALTLQRNEYERSTRQNRVMIMTCHLYHLEVYTRFLNEHYNNRSFANIAIKSYGDLSWSPIPTELLYWRKPGSRELHFNLNKNIPPHLSLGSNFVIKALYKFCCVGLRCQTCPLTLNLHALEQKILVNRSLQMDCREYFFNYSIDVIQQPKNYSIEISYYLNGDERSTRKRTLGTTQVSESTLYSCTLMDSRHHGCVAEWTVQPHIGYLNKSLNNAPNVKDCPKSCFCYGAEYESPHFPWKDAFRNISLCVRFAYRLPSQGLSRLDVYVHMGSKDQHIWSAQGYQGEVWKNGSIPIVRIKEKFKILFNISSNVNITTCGIRDFRLSSSECDLLPKHAEPGYRCADSQYQCNNGICIDKYKRCDGVKDDCIDGSDEDRCPCLTNQFTCFDGSCVDVSKLCNAKLNCESEDEMRCDDEHADCPVHQCIDGSCPSPLLPCEDMEFNISECWNSNKYHTNICREQNDHCKTTKGICGFDAGPCGMENDGWRYNLPTNKNYKSFDHSFLKQLLHCTSKKQPIYS